MPELSEDELAFAHRMFELAREGSSEELVAYVDAGLPVDLTNSNGDTLLMLAAYHVHPELVVTLLARGADHARTNRRGQTALAAAVFRGSVPIVTALLDAGADVDAGSPSARETAQFFELPDMAALLAR